MTATITLPTLAAARLVAGHVDILWQQTQNGDEDFRGCCPQCCAPCAALKELLATGQLDFLYGEYLASTGGFDTETYDAPMGQVGREWLLKAWSVDRVCHQKECT